MTDQGGVFAERLAAGVSSIDRKVGGWRADADKKVGS